MPPQNQQVKNLFDVVIPFTVIQYPDDLPERVRSIVQMQINSNRPFLATAPGFFPRTFTNTTPRQLLSEYLRLCPADVRVSVKPQSDELEFRRPMLAVLIDKLRNLFHR